MRRSLIALLTLALTLSMSLAIAAPHTALGSTAPPAGQVVGGWGFTEAIANDGTVWGWGTNSYGELGDGSKTKQLQPVQAAGLTNVVALAAGTGHSLAVTSSGKVYAWGDNEYGQLGEGGKVTYALRPVQTSAITTAVAVAGGARHSLALLKDGTVWAWGDNARGQLGTPGKDSATPIKVAGLTGVKAIASGAFHSLALKTDGTVWAWGGGDYGQLGTGRYDDSDKPVQVQGLTGVVAVSAGQRHSIALKSDGTVWAWGGNNQYQLGLEGKDTANRPAQVPSLEGVAAIAAGGSFNLALTPDGTVWSWGSNDFGQLGDGTTTDAAAPVQVGRLPAAAAIGAGYDHAMAVDTEGSVWTWGTNDCGQLGDGTTHSSVNPIKVENLVLSVSAPTAPTQPGSGQTQPTPPSQGQNGNPTPGVPKAGAFTLKGSAAGLSVNLQWTAPVRSDVVGYYLYRSTKSGQYDIPLTDFPLPSLSYSDFQVAKGDSYYYRVAPLLQSGQMGDATGEVKVTVTGDLQVPKQGVVLQFNNPIVYVNGQAYKLHATGSWPILINSRMFAPVDSLVKQLGGSATFSADGKVLTLTLNGHTVKAEATKHTIVVDGTEKPIDTAATQYNGVMYLPLRYVMDGLGYDLAWGAADGTVLMTPKSGKATNPKPPTPEPKPALSDIYWVEAGTKFVVDGKVLFEDLNGIYSPYRSPDKQYVAYSRGDNRVMLYNRQTGAVTNLYESSDDDYKLYPVGWSADSTEIGVDFSHSSGYSGGNKLWIIGLDGEVKATVTSSFRYAHWGLNGQFIVSSGTDMSILNRQGATVATLTDPGYAAYVDMADIALSPDGKTAVYHVDNNYFVHDVATDTWVKATALTKLSMAGPAKILPDGRVLVADEGGVYVYDSATAKKELYARATKPSYPNY